MNFNSIIGHERIKKHLLESIQQHRIPHAQLFIGNDGVGVLPVVLAYATEVLALNEKEHTRTKCEQLIHPDLHFCFPVAVTSKEDKPTSNTYMKEFRDFVRENPYGNLFDWYQYVGFENKQGNINVRQANEIAEKLILRSFEGGYKIMVIFMAEIMNMECANKLLKLLEEPPAKTLFLLIAKNEHQVLQTIRSRCQITYINRFSDQDIEKLLIGKGISEQNAKVIAVRSQGNYREALQYIKNLEEGNMFETWFIIWVRAAFSAKKNKQAILPLLKLSNEISKEIREVQKQFLDYCIEVFRQAFFLNYGIKELIYIYFQDETFKFEKFSQFVHENNFPQIIKEIQNASYHIERNGNGKIIFTDLSIQLTRLIHVK